jgi:CBS domain-containing protein
MRADRRQVQRLLPVVNREGQLVGVLTREDIQERLEQEGSIVPQRSIGELVRKDTVKSISRRTSACRGLPNGGGRVYQNAGCRAR